MGYYICHACGKGLCHHSVNCYGIADTNELICEDCVTDYLCALEERSGEVSDWNGDQFPTFDRELFDAYQERQRQAAHDRQAAWMARQDDQYLQETLAEDQADRMDAAREQMRRDREDNRPCDGPGPHERAALAAITTRHLQTIRFSPAAVEAVSVHRSTGEDDERLQAATAAVRERADALDLPCHELTFEWCGVSLLAQEAEGGVLLVETADEVRALLDAEPWDVDGPEQPEDY